MTTTHQHQQPDHRMTPSPGRIVEYILNEDDVEQINRRRADATRSGFAGEATGAVVHVGNHVYAGNSYPMVITRVWAAVPTPDTVVNGQVLLDGNDTYWVTSRGQAPQPHGDLRGQWRPFPRVAAPSATCATCGRALAAGDQLCCNTREQA